MPRRNKKRNKNKNKVRNVIALEAAKMMYIRAETEYFSAKRKAAKRIGIDYRYNPSDLPSNKEIRNEILKVADLFEGEKRLSKLQDMRLFALWILGKLKTFHPYLIGSTLTGHIRKGSDIDIHVFSDSLSALTSILDDNGFQYDIEKKRIVKFNEERFFTHVHLHARFEVELTLYKTSFINYRFKSSITGKAIERANQKELKTLILKEAPYLNIAEEMEKYEENVECYEMFKLLLLPLINVKGNPNYHPEGDALYHSLQVFELAKQGHGYDLEFLQACLFHDIGKAIHPASHAYAGADAIEGFVSPRVTFLIRHHMEALELKRGTLGYKKRIRLKQSEFFDDLMELRELDSKGREKGVLVDTVEEAFDYLKSLEKHFQEGYYEGFYCNAF